MDVISLFDLNSLVKESLEQCLPEAYWVKAELSNVNVNRSGHCYLEIIERNSSTSAIIAKASAVIWRSNYTMIKNYFQEATGQSFASGIKVALKVLVNFHELYGYKLIVVDVDPTYTIGDSVLKRNEIIVRLKKDGVLTLNKELELTELPQRIAVISSATAAGYEDFCHQLEANSYHLKFHIELFQAYMQGSQIESSILNALNQINDRIDDFDVVVIIRGGGASSELSDFDSYLLAASCAQFPLPIITGIGHERDKSVLDLVAYECVKTPTAAAEFLISRITRYITLFQNLIIRLNKSVDFYLEKEQKKILELSYKLTTRASNLLLARRQELQTIDRQLNTASVNLISAEQHKLSNESNKLRNKFANLLQTKRYQLNTVEQKLNHSLKDYILKKQFQLQFLEEKLMNLSPDKILAQGYTMVNKDGQLIKHASELKSGDELTLIFQDGNVSIIVK